MHAFLHLAEGKEDALNEGSRLVDGLLQSHEQLEVQTLVLGNVISHARIQDQMIESACVAGSEEMSETVVKR